MRSLLLEKTIEVEADKAIYIGIADVAQVLGRRILFVRNSTVRSRDEPCEQKREDLLLRREVTLLLAPSYKATNEMRGRSQVNCIRLQQLAAPNLCPAANGRDRCLPSNQSVELQVKLAHRHSLAQEIHKGSYVCCACEWLACFMSCCVDNLTQRPGRSGKSGTLFTKGLLFLFPIHCPFCQFYDTNEFLRGDEELMLLSDH